MSQIHQELQTLKSELDKLETVRQNFESARQVTTSIVEQLTLQGEKLNNHIGQVIPIYDKNLQENLMQTQDKLVVMQRNIQEEVNKVVFQWQTVADDYHKGLSNHLQILQKKLEDSQKITEDKTNESTKKWKEVADIYNVSLAEHLRKLQGDFELSGRNIQKNVSDATIPISDLNQRIVILLDELHATHGHIQNLTKNNEDLVGEIRKIDFPSRLDKIDNTVSAINLGLQNVQSRLSDNERNIKETLINTEKNLQSQILDLEPKLNSIKVFQWVILILLGCTLIFNILIYIKR